MTTSALKAEHDLRMRLLRWAQERNVYLRKDGDYLESDTEVVERLIDVVRAAGT